MGTPRARSPERAWSTRSPWSRGRASRRTTACPRFDRCSLAQAEAPSPAFGCPRGLQAQAARPAAVGRPPRARRPREARGEAERRGGRRRVARAPEPTASGTRSARSRRPRSSSTPGTPCIDRTPRSSSGGRRSSPGDLKLRIDGSTQWSLRASSVGPTPWGENLPRSGSRASPQVVLPDDQGTRAIERQPDRCRPRPTIPPPNLWTPHNGDGSGDRGTAGRDRGAPSGTHQELAKIADERQKLFQAFYANAIPLELLKSEQDRLTERSGQPSTAATSQRPTSAAGGTCCGRPSIWPATAMPRT